MKTGKMVGYIALCTSLLIFISSWIPSLYQPKRQVEQQYTEIMSIYQQAAEMLGLPASTFQGLLSIEAVEQKQDSLQLQEAAKQLLQEVALEGSYDLHEQQIQQIANELQGVYDREIKTFDISEGLKQLRMMSLGAILLSELVILYTTRKKKG